jgi:hypothetical protein
MKRAKKSNTVKSQSIQTRVKKSLDKYANEVLFPEKLAKANKLLKGVKVPVR